jgi:hypothetical protein
MPLTDHEMKLARAALEKHRRRAPLASIPPAFRTAEEHDLAKKYPRSTLEQAREIDATGPTVPKQHEGQSLGFISGFELLRHQERGNYHLSGDHT